MEIKKIKTKKELSKVILFLQNYFNWSKDKALKIQESLILNNKLLGIYGYMLIEKKKLLNGAFLIFFQGYKENEQKKIMLLNMSSWYVVPKARGLYSLLMIKNLINDFSDAAITNVTSNKTAYKVLRALGFKDSKNLNRKYTLLSLFYNFEILKRDSLQFIFDSYSRKTCKNPKIVFMGEYKCMDFLSNGSKLKVLTCPAILEKNFGFLKLKFRGLRIIWTSDKDIFNKLFFRILVFYFIRNFLFFITTHCESENLKNNYIGESKQIYFSKDFDLRNVNIALGSELSFF